MNQSTGCLLNLKLDLENKVWMFSPCNFSYRLSRVYNFTCYSSNLNFNVMLLVMLQSYQRDLSIPKI